MDKTISIFTDAATSPQAGIAIGVFLCLDEQTINEYAECSTNALTAMLSGKITSIKFETNKSTWSEIKTVISALRSVLADDGAGCKITLYTDCQSVCDLIGKRKDKLIKSHFVTREGKTLRHANLYKELFEITEALQVTIIKVKGHHAKSQRLTLQENIFSIIDKHSRRELKLALQNDID